MEIILVIYGSIDQVTGGYLYDRKVVERLRGDGISVRLHALKRRPYLCSMLQGLNGKLRDLLRDDKEKDGPLIVVDELTHPSFFLPLLFRFRPLVHLVTLVHHLYSDERIGSTRRLIARMLERVLLNRSALIVVNSSSTEVSVRRWLKTAAPIRVCRPGCDTLQDTAGSAMPEDRGLFQQEVRLLAVGNVIPRKGHLLLVSALATMAELSWHLALVGKDEPHTRYSKRLHAAIEAGQIEGRVHFAGTIEDEELVRLYRNADLFLFPSSHEGYGIALAEALRFGLPYVAFESGGVREICSCVGECGSAEEGGGGVEHSPAYGRLEGVFACRGGFVVSRDHPDTFGVILRRLIEDGELRRRLSAEARERSSALPTWEETGTCFHRALQALAAQA